jgi:hypothetical protein
VPPGGGGAPAPHDLTVRATRTVWLARRPEESQVPQ